MDAGQMHAAGNKLVIKGMWRSLRKIIKNGFRLKPSGLPN